MAKFYIMQNSDYKLVAGPFDGIEEAQNFKKNNIEYRYGTDICKMEDEPSSKHWAISEDEIRSQREAHEAYMATFSGDNLEMLERNHHSTPDHEDRDNAIHNLLNN